jgi:uncharacterized cupin superfamily protein
MPSTAPHTIQRLAVASATLEPLPIAPEDIVSGSPEASWSLMWRNEAGTLFNGVWRCTPGAFYLRHADETVTVVEGRATITPDGGEPVELAAGDTAFIPAGARVLWEVHETVCKSFHNHDADGTMLAG